MALAERAGIAGLARGGRPFVTDLKFADLALAFGLFFPILAAISFPMIFNGFA